MLSLAETRAGNSLLFRSIFLAALSKTTMARSLRSTFLESLFHLPESVCNVSSIGKDCEEYKQRVGGRLLSPVLVLGGRTAEVCTQYQRTGGDGYMAHSKEGLGARVATFKNALAQ